MRGLTLHLESIDFINKLIENNPDLNITIKDALVDKVIKRLIGKDYTMLRLEDDVRKLIKEEVGNNAARLESPEEAREKDKKTLNSWIGHPHLRVFDNSTKSSHTICRYYVLVLKLQIYLCQ